MANFKLEVPHVSQEESIYFQNAKFANDCGAACALMFLKAYGKDPEGLTVNELYKQAYPVGLIPVPKKEATKLNIKVEDQGLKVVDIQKVLKEKYGFETLGGPNMTIKGLITILKEQKPVIVLVQYKPLVEADYTSFKKTTSSNHDFAHFMVVFGLDDDTPGTTYFYVHDPENYNKDYLKDGNFTKMESSIFETAWKQKPSFHSGLYPTEPIPDASQLSKNKVQTAESLLPNPPVAAMPGVDPGNPPVAVMPVVDPGNPPVVVMPVVDPGNPPVAVMPVVDPGNPPVPPILGVNSVPYQVKAITGINVRSGPNYDLKTIAYLQPSDEVTIIAENPEQTYGMFAEGQWITLNLKYVEKVVTKK